MSVIKLRILWFLAMTTSLASCWGCWEEERLALLRIKANINFPNGTRLPSWVDEENSKCCEWEGVECDVTTRRVIGLYLNDTKAERNPGVWSFNASLFLSFEKLRKLDLSRNDLDGWIEHQGFDRLTRLSKLELLDLRGNLLNISILPHLRRLSSLTDLYLGSNAMEGSFHSSMCELQNLQLLDLSNNEFGGLIPSCLGNLSSLQFLDLANNKLGGTFPSWLLLNNTRLQYINLRNNAFTGHLNLPSHLNSHISQIDFSDNNIQGQISANMSSVFPNLRILNLSNNELVGNINSCIKNMTSLWVLDLSNNNLSGIIPELLGASCPLLWLLKLSNNNFNGQVSPAISLPHVQFLYLDGNHFTEVPKSLASTSLVTLDLSNNHFTGNLPRWIGNLTGLMEISMSRNHFQGAIPTEFCELHSLQFLDLSENSLLGSVPSCFNFLTIRYLHLHKNSLQGPLHAFYNISFPPPLVTLNLGDNNLSGKVPNWIGNLSTLGILSLKSNHFTGEIPAQLCLLREISMMDLSGNSIFGSIPPCLGSISFMGNSGITEATKVLIANDDPHDALNRFAFLDALEEMEFTTKHLSQTYKGYILDLMSGIDLSCNQLSGEIPIEIGNISMIRALNLSHNNLIGPIPTTFSSLKHVESLDLSYNNLSGRIPPQLIQLTFLAVFSVAHNNLSGPIPERKAQFGTFPESSYDGNPYLFGPPLRKCKPTSNRTNGHKEEDTGFIDMDVFYPSFVASYIIMLLGIVAALHINSYWRRAWLYYTEVYATRAYYFLVDHFFKFCYCNM